jgi:thioredoxin 1
MIELTTDSFDAEVLHEENPVMIDFWGPACRPCLGLMPTVERTAAQFEGRLKVAKVNAAQNRRLCINLKVMSLPTFLIFSGGKEVDRLTGEVAPKQVEELAARWGGGDRPTGTL